MDVLELGEVAESPGHVERHRGEAAVGDLVEVLPVVLVHQVASAGEGGENIQFRFSLMSNWEPNQDESLNVAHPPTKALYYYSSAWARG